MATRIDIQIALDFIRFVNIAHDLFDSIITIIDGGTGLSTDVEKRESISRTLDNIENYTNVLISFRNDSGKRQKLIDGLTSLNISLPDLVTDIQLFVSKRSVVRTMVNDAGVLLSDISQVIRNDISPLPLVRKG